MLTVVPDLSVSLPADGPSSSLIDQLVREGARQMLAAALQAEVAAYVGQFADVRCENGQRLVVRNGTAELGAMLVAAGLGPPPEHALISLLALHGLRVSEATGADVGPRTQCEREPPIGAAT